MTTHLTKQLAQLTKQRANHSHVPHADRDVTIAITRELTELKSSGNGASRPGEDKALSHVDPIQWRRLNNQDLVGSDQRVGGSPEIMLRKTHCDE